ncbi:MAG: DUF2493 domain-containing protein [Pseudomonadota bacterium]
MTNGLADLGLGTLAQRLDAQFISLLYREIDHLERDADTGADVIARFAREQDGSEVADVERQATIAKQHRRSEMIAALGVIREAAAEAYAATTGETWQPRSGSRAGPRVTAAQIDAREIAASRRRAREAALNPTGPRIAVTGDTADADPSLIFDKLDRIRDRHPDMVLVTKGARGAVASASRGAATRQLPQIAVAPDWSGALRRAAPFKPNDEIIAMKPIGVAVFGGNGLALNLSQKAEHPRIKVWHVQLQRAHAA